MALTACAPTAAPTPSPVPTVPQCTPLDGGAPYACTQSEHDTLAEQHALYDEAEQVLRRYRAELDRQEADWRLREMTPEFEATTTGAYRDFVEQFIEADRNDEASRIGEPAPIVWVKPLIGASRDGSVAALQFCSDASTTEYVTKENPSPFVGGTVKRTYYFVPTDGSHLKIAASDAEEVDAC
ncbi:MAG: hypothetical protein Q4F65_08185 [Propionibacteriaceae bacterium]|nr:hypothetical protein [Propionibacteriaceae bacterium]